MNYLKYLGGEKRMVRKAHKCSTWKRDRIRMVKALIKSTSMYDGYPTVETLKRFTNYSKTTKAAVIANYTRGAYDSLI